MYALSCVKCAGDDGDAFENAFERYYFYLIIKFQQTKWNLWKIEHPILIASCLLSDMFESHRRLFFFRLNSLLFLNFALRLRLNSFSTYILNEKCSQVQWAKGRTKRQRKRQESNCIIKLTWFKSFKKDTTMRIRMWNHIHESKK